MRTYLKRTTASPARIPAARLFAVVFLLVAVGTNQVQAEKVSIRAAACDSMINLMTAWAEAYRHVEPNVFMNVNGDGPSGDHFGALQHNHRDIIGACHQITPEWRAKISTTTAVNERK